MKKKTVKLWVGREQKKGHWQASMCDYFIDKAPIDFDYSEIAICSKEFHKLFDLRLKPGDGQVRIEFPRVKCKILKRLAKEKNHETS